MHPRSKRNIRPKTSQKGREAEEATRRDVSGSHHHSGGGGASVHPEAGEAEEHKLQAARPGNLRYGSAVHHRCDEEADETDRQVQNACFEAESGIPGGEHPCQLHSFSRTARSANNANRDCARMSIA